MEQRGSGLGRMKAAMLDHGLGVPEFDNVDGYFQVTLRGPGDNLERLRIPPSKDAGSISPAVEQTLNERQKKMAELLLQTQELTSRKCQELFGISSPTAAADFQTLIEAGIAKKVGKGRSTRYVLDSSPNH